MFLVKKKHDHHHDHDHDDDHDDDDDAHDRPSAYTENFDVGPGLAGEDPRAGIRTELTELDVS